MKATSSAVRSLRVAFRRAGLDTRDVGRLAVFDPFSAQIPDDPYPLFRELRDHAPVYRNDERDFWALSRYDDVQRASRDWQAFTSGDGVEQDRWGKSLSVSSFIGEDPPRHDQLRSILRKHFVPKQMQSLEAAVARITAALLRDAIEDRHADLAADFAWPLAVSVVCELLGLPDADRSQIQQWLDQMLSAKPGRHRGARCRDRHREDRARVLRDRSGVSPESSRRRGRALDDDLRRTRG